MPKRLNFNQLFIWISFEEESLFAGLPPAEVRGAAGKAVKKS